MSLPTLADHKPSAATAPESPVEVEILCLNRADDAAKSGSTHRPVVWISSQPPQALVGILEQGIEGAWYQPGQIVVSLQGRTFVYRVSPPPDAELHSLLKSAVQMHLAGVSPNAIQTSLTPSHLQLHSPDLIP